MQHLSSNNKFSTIFFCWVHGALALHCYCVFSVHTLFLYLATSFTSWYYYSIVLWIQIFSHSGWSCISNQHIPPSLGMKNNPSGICMGQKHCSWLGLILRVIHSLANSMSSFWIMCVNVKQRQSLQCTYNTKKTVIHNLLEHKNKCWGD